jgi:hypothetical protein
VIPLSVCCDGSVKAMCDVDAVGDQSAFGVESSNTLFQVVVHTSVLLPAGRCPTRAAATSMHQSTLVITCLPVLQHSMHGPA